MNQNQANIAAMKHLKFLLVITFAFISLPGSAQPQDYDPDRYIEWNEFYKLSWDNFENTVSDDTFGDAGTAVKIIAKPYFVGKRIEYNVYPLFDRKKSWVYEKDPALLAHEQLHFDIAELYARKIRKKVATLQAENNKDLSYYNTEINKLLLESNELDMQYDMETLHGGIKVKQTEWREKINVELKTLEKFKKQKKVIGNK